MGGCGERMCLRFPCKPCPVIERPRHETSVARDTRSFERAFLARTHASYVQREGERRGERSSELRPRHESRASRLTRRGPEKPGTFGPIVEISSYPGVKSNRAALLTVAKPERRAAHFVTTTEVVRHALKFSTRPTLPLDLLQTRAHFPPFRQVAVVAGGGRVGARQADVE